MKKALDQLVSYIVLGVIIFAFIVGIIFLSYLFIFGALIGMGLFLIKRIKDFFYPPSQYPTTQDKPGRIIEHEDKK